MHRIGWHIWLQRRSMVMLGIVLLAVVLGAARSEARPHNQASLSTFLPLIVKDRLAPRATTSYYITKATSERSAELLGCAAAVEMQQKQIAHGFVALFFGKPAYYQDYPGGPFQYGTNLVGDFNKTFIAINWIEVRVHAWIRGFVNGYHYPASQYDCGINENIYPYRPRVTLAIGITNEPLDFSSSGNTTTTIFTPSTSPTEDHAKAWANFTNRTHEYLTSNEWEDVVVIVTGYDSEILYNSAEGTKNWLQAYTTNTPHRFYYLGACEGCPYPQPWNTQDIWDVTAGFGATLIPQIYTTNGQTAKQWGLTAAILRETPDPTSGIPGVYLRPLVFNGVLTQHQACDDRGGDSNPPVSGSEFCKHGEEYNTPEQAWMQTYDSFLKYGFFRYLPWATDVRWNQDFSQFIKP